MLEATPCPHCDAVSYNGFRNNELQKELQNVEVHCSHQREGCAWTGKLKKLDRHLRPADGRSATASCQFVEVSCPACSQPVKLKSLQTHRAESCLQRPYECQHCGEHRSTFEDVVTNHAPKCKFFPRQCPNSCGEVVMSIDMESHVRNDCPLRVLDCEFLAFGCSAKFCRQLMQKHLDEKTSMHAVMLARTFQESMQKADDERREMMIELRQLREENQYLLQRVESLDLTKSHMTPIVIMNNGAGESPDVVPGNSGRDVNLVVSAEFTMETYSKLKRENKNWYSPPFYTQQRGHRMYLQVLANGEGANRGQYLSIYIYFLHGEFDNEIVWPFVGDLVIELVNQEKGVPPYRKTLRYTEATPRKYCDKVTVGTRSLDGKGLGNFIHLSELPLKYLQNDQLLFRVLRYRHAGTKKTASSLL